MKQNKCILLFFFIIVSSHFSFAQHSKIDSLLSHLKTQKEDTNKVNTLNELAWQKRNFNPDTSILLGKEAIMLSEKIKWDKGISKSEHNTGVFYFSKGDFTVSLQYFFKALELREKTQDKKGISNSLGVIGVVYRNLKENEKAIEYLFKAKKIAEELGDKNLTATHIGNIGSVYNNQKNYAKALDLYMQALGICEELKNKEGMARHLSNIGTVYIDIGNYKQALDCFFRAAEINESLNRKSGIAINFCNIGNAYAQLNNFVEAEKYYQKSMKLATELNAIDLIRQVEEPLSDLYFKNGKFKLALQHYKSFIVARDSISSEENTKKQTQTEMNYEFDKKETLARVAQEKKDAITNADKQKQKVVLVLILTSLLIVIIFSIVIFRSLRITKKQKAIIGEQKIVVEAQKELVEEKQKEVLDSIHYAKRIQSSLLPTEKYITKHFNRLRNVLPFIVFVFFASHANAQTKKIDSLKLQLLKAHEDTVKLNILITLSNEADILECLKYAEEADKLADRLINQNNGINRSELLSQKAVAINNIGYGYMSLGSTSKGLEYYFKSLKILEGVGDKSKIAESLNNIGFIFSEEGEDSTAIYYFEKSLKLHRVLNNKYYVSLALYNIASVHRENGDSAKALPLFREALKISKEIDDKLGVAWSLNSIGAIYSVNHQYEKALDYYFEAKKISGEIEDFSGLSLNCGNIGVVYMEEKKYDQAKTFFIEAATIAKAPGLLGELEAAESKLCDVYTALSDYKEAYIHYKNHIAIKDSLKNNENTKKIIQAQMKFDFEKKETEAKAQQDKIDAVAAEEKLKQKIVLLLVSVVLLLVVIFSLVVFRSLRIAKKQKAIIEEQKIAVEVQKELVEEKQKEIIDSIHYAKRIQRSLLPTEKYITKSILRLKKS